MFSQIFDMIYFNLATVNHENYSTVHEHLNLIQNLIEKPKIAQIFVQSNKFFFEGTGKDV